MAESPVQNDSVGFTINKQLDALTWVVRLSKIKVMNLDNFSLTISIVSSVVPYRERS